MTEEIVVQIWSLQRVATGLSLQVHKSFMSGLKLWWQSMTASTLWIVSMLHAQSIAHLTDDHGLLTGRLESMISPITDRVGHAHTRMNAGAGNVCVELELHTNRFQMLEQTIAMRDT